MSRAEFRRARDDGERATRRDALLRAARELFDARAWADVTMAAVAAEAGVSKGTPYLYFSTKEALFLELLTVELDAWMRVLVPALVPGLGPAATAALFADSLAARPTLVGLLGHLHGTLEVGADEASLTAFKTELLDTLGAAAPRLEAAVGAAPGAGVRLFLHTHALVVGLGQMANEPPLLAALLADAPFSALHVDLRVELAAALTALFAGARSV